MGDVEPMRTLFDFDLEDNPAVTVDGRAKQRDKGTPANTDVRWVESYGEALKKANQFVPCAIIKDNGSCVLFGCGGGGLVWVCSTNGEVSESQQTMVDLILNHLSWLGAVIQTSIPLPYFDL